MRYVFAVFAVFAFLVSVVAQPRPRARDLGIVVGIYPSGARNAITDVDGVRVGHTTIIEADRVRTGVTAIVPHGGNVFQDKVAGAVFVGNAFGKLAGSTQVNELGTIETPIVLTNTLSVGTAMDAVVRYSIAQPGNERVRSVNALVGETNDGGLNDIRGLHVTREHVIAAITSAAGGPVAEGTVGAGTGTMNYGWKGGIGTSSRKLPADRGGYVVGVLAQTNFGGNLTIAGVPIFRTLQPPNARIARADGSSSDELRMSEGDGSCMLVAATDAPLDARDLRRLAARAIFGLARTGSSYSHGSGDFAIAFSTSPEVRSRFNETTARAHTLLPAEATSPLFEAALEATEEAVYNALFQATTVRSAFGTAEAIPIDRVKELLKR
ncbi:MAG TPA: P1 family peptidase [Vicinamibacterales bacterium]|jgi:D-aminopeptidase|nr:P1 family peptidase [Vicinamibacterales bacterium]